MRIYLTGFMGSGKTTVGPRVAARLGQPFLDLDRLIRAHDGRSIPQIFAEEGEAGFREQEADFLRKTADTEDLVVALGGGALVDADNRAFAKEHGRVIYLEVSPATIVERVGEEAEQRPLLQDEEGTPLAGAALLTRIESMLDERRESYEAAHATVDANQLVEAVETAVVETVQERGWTATPRFHDL